MPVNKYTPGCTCCLSEVCVNGEYSDDLKSGGFGGSLILQPDVVVTGSEDGANPNTCDIPEHDNCNLINGTYQEETPGSSLLTWLYQPVGPLHFRVFVDCDGGSSIIVTHRGYKEVQGGTIHYMISQVTTTGLFVDGSGRVTGSVVMPPHNCTDGSFPVTPIGDPIDCSSFTVKFNGG